MQFTRQQAAAEAEEAEDASVTTDTPADSVETWTIGPLTLGMTGDEIQESLGAPDAEVLHYTVPFDEVSRAIVRLQKTQETPEKYPRRFKKIQTSPL